MSDRQSRKRRWFSYKSSYNPRSGPERNIDKKVQLFRGPLAFYPTMEDVCCPGSGTKQAQPAGRREGEVNKPKLGSFVLCALLLALAVKAQAQQSAKIPRIGYLTAASA